MLFIPNCKKRSLKVVQILSDFTDNSDRFTNFISVLNCYMIISMLVYILTLIDNGYRQQIEIIPLFIK